MPRKTISEPDSARNGAQLDTVSHGLPHQIYLALREQILEGLLPPGQRIVQDAVAAEFSASRIPVREALRQLASEGLVTIERDVGARVAPLNPNDLHEIYLMRESLEPVAVRASVPLLGQAELDAMAELVEHGDWLAERDDIAGYLKMDTQFHEITVVTSGLMRLHRSIHQLWDLMRQFRGVYSLLPSSLPQSNVEHRGLLEACTRGAAEDAADLHRIHIRRTRLTLDQHPEWFTTAPEQQAKNR
jgi:GntR family transcriptional regulator, rspAB operon transcriptional repressor